MDEGHARVKMEDVERHLSETRFAWIGGTEPTSVFYYRIHSPVILIEFDHQRPRTCVISPRIRSCHSGSTFTSWCGRQTETTTGRISCASTWLRARTEHTKVKGQRSKVKGQRSRSKVEVKVQAKVLSRFLPAVSFALMANAAAAQELTIDRVGWLQGCWRSNTGPTTVEEQWMAPRGGSVLGMGRTVRAGRTADYELVLISEMNGRLAYKAHPAGQPSATFVSTMASDTSIVFENPEHDFPQRVGYRRDGADGLQAWIEGQANGKPRRVDFSYQRAQCEAPLEVEDSD